jgi:hypothetical protein
MADFSGCTLTPEQYSQEVAAQLPRLKIETNVNTAVFSPFANVLEGGTVANNENISIRTLVRNRSFPGHSIVAPTFTRADQVCGTKGEQTTIGQTEFITQLETLRGRGPLVCVNESRYAVLDSYTQAELSIKDAVTQLVNNDIRYQLLVRSGVKATVQAGVQFSSQVNGGINQVAVPFPAIGLPTAPPTFEYLVRLRNFVQQTMRVQTFGSGSKSYAVAIGSADTVEYWRNQANIREDFRALTTGRYLQGYEGLSAYEFTDIPFRGLAFGIDQEPLRFDEVDENGFPVLIEPVLNEAGDYGFNANPTNPAWLNAKYEISFLVFRNSFKRIVPERFTGEGTFRFAPQMAMGELQWVFRPDNDCNLFGDFGQHIYQVTRAFQAVQPHAVIPIIHTRCDADLGLVACESYSGSLSLD